MSDQDYALDDSLFASPEVHERDVDLADGEKHRLYFREMTAVEYRRYTMDERSEDDERRAAAVARAISISLVTPEGRNALTMQRAGTLKPAVAGAILLAILDVNGMLRKKDEQGNA